MVDIFCVLYLSLVKGVNFFGLKSEYVVSGSDCGNVFLWDTDKENIVQYMDGDFEGVVSYNEVPLLLSLISVLSPLALLTSPPSSPHPSSLLLLLFLSLLSSSLSSSSSSPPLPSPPPSPRPSPPSPCPSLPLSPPSPPSILSWSIYCITSKRECIY